MITQETIEIDGKKYRYTKSDTYMIHKVGDDALYIEAIDVIDSKDEYEESDIKIAKELKEVRS